MGRGARLRHTGSPMADSTLVMPASACWTLLGFGICTGTVVGALPGLLEEGPLGKEALVPLEVDGPEGRSCGPRWERLECNRDWLPGAGGVAPQGLVVFNLGADLAPDSEGLLYGAKAWWAPETVAVRWGAWGAG